MFRSLFANLTGVPKATETGQPHSGGKTAVKQLAPHDLQTWLESTDSAPLLVDVRTPAEYEYDGHIANSILLPLDALMQRMQELPKDRPIVFVCRSGSRSQMACEMMAAQGYNASNLYGGMIAWKRFGLPSQ